LGWSFFSSPRLKRLKGWIDLLKRIRALIRKELLSILRDPKTRISLLAPPIFQLFIFTFAATLDVQNVSIGILNRDNGEKGFELVQRFVGAPTFKKITYLSSVQEVAPFIDQQKGIMVLSIDEHFSRDLDALKPAVVQTLFDGRKSNSAQIVFGYASSIVEQFNLDLGATYNVETKKTELFQRNWFNPNLLYYWYNIPSLVATLSMITCIIVTSISVARERELGTFDQLLVSPLSPLEILIGKITPGVIVGTLEGLLLFAAGVFIFQVPFTGSFFLFLISILLFTLSVSGVGLFISSLSSTQQQAMLGAFVFLVPSVLLSGFATPVENMPQWLQPLAQVIPLTHMLVLSKGLFLKAMPLKIVLTRLWPMVVVGLFTLTGAGIFFRKRLE
jgi:ABC-2 type transport system permease protein